LKARVVIAVILIFTGIVLSSISAWSIVQGASLLAWLMPLAVGTLLCLAGLVLLITELLEAWLSRGQKALVDGLQAG